MKSMILAAGYGKRLAPLTDNIPKPLLEVGTQSLIKRNINYLVDNGFSEIIINVSYLGEKITNHVKAEFPNLDILFSIEDEPLGTGGGILHALPIIGDEPFLLMNSDIFHEINIKNLPKDVKAAHLIGVPNPGHNINGDFTLNDSLVEVKDDKNELTWSGISVINPIIFYQAGFTSKNFNIWDTVLPSYIKEGAITGQKSSDLWVDVGTPERLKIANTVYNDQN